MSTLNCEITLIFEMCLSKAKYERMEEIYFIWGKNSQNCCSAPSQWTAKTKPTFRLFTSSYMNRGPGPHLSCLQEEGGERRETQRWKWWEMDTADSKIKWELQLILPAWPDKGECSIAPTQCTHGLTGISNTFHLVWLDRCLTLAYWVETGWWVLVIQGENFWCFSLMTWLIFFQRPFTLGSGEGWLGAPRCALTLDTRPLGGWKPMTAET